MSFNTERQDIESFFNTNFTPPPGVGVFYENIPIPNNNTSPYVTLLVRTGGEAQASLGSSTDLFRNSGFIVIEIRHDLDSGTAAALSIADTVSDLFRAQQIGNRITIINITPDRIGSRNGWYQINVLIEFRRDDFK